MAPLALSTSLLLALSPLSLKPSPNHFVLSNTPQRSHQQHTQRVPHSPTLAYNPQPSKARPKKSKAPKEKVKVSAEQSLQLVPEQTFFEGPPSITETFIPGLSLFTVVGVIPFTASLARQAWTRYKITNKRLEVVSGFQGKDTVQVTWREVTDVKWLRRYGGSCGDLVLTLKDGAKIELRSVPEFDRNLKFLMDQLTEGTAQDCGYPDKPARDYLERVASGEEPAPELAAPTEAAAPEAELAAPTEAAAPEAATE